MESLEFIGICVVFFLFFFWGGWEGRGVESDLLKFWVVGLLRVWIVLFVLILVFKFGCPVVNAYVLCMYIYRHTHTHIYTHIVCLGVLLHMVFAHACCFLSLVLRAYARRSLRILEAFGCLCWACGV